MLQRYVLAAGVLIALAAGILSDDALRPPLRETPLADIRYGVSTAVNVLGLVALAAVIALLGGRKGRDLLSLSGLRAPVARPILFALGLFLPATAISAASAPIADDLSLYDLAFTAGLFPVMEEIAFRGLALGALMGLCGWRFFPAALAPALLFGLAHISQGSEPMEIAGIVAITAVGGLLFGWLFVRWGFNLWPAIFVHMGLNALWSVFALGDNAIGGWFGNALRLAVIAAGVGLTLLLAPKPARN